jgi:hypothetical protein
MEIVLVLLMVIEYLETAQYVVTYGSEAQAHLNDAMETLEGKVELASSLVSLSLLEQI